MATKVFLSSGLTLSLKAKFSMSTVAYSVINCAANTSLPLWPICSLATTHACTHTHTHWHTRTCIHTHACTHTHMYTYTHIISNRSHFSHLLGLPCHQGLAMVATVLSSTIPSWCIEQRLDKTKQWSGHNMPAPWSGKCVCPGYKNSAFKL